MDKRDMPVVILLLGPTGSGKSTFVNHVAKQQARTGVAGDAKPYTTECRRYDFKLDGEDCTIVDTPGFGDTQPSLVKTLTRISEMQKATGIHPSTITGALYFHRITDGKLTGTLRATLEIFKRICGEKFYLRVAFVTTMWDIIKGGAFERYNRLHTDLDRRYLRLSEHGPEIFKCRNDEPSCKAVVRYFSELAKSSTGKGAQLLLFEEISLGFNVRRTAAGREIIKRTAGGGGCTIL